MGVAGFFLHLCFATHKSLIWLAQEKRSEMLSFETGLFQGFRRVISARASSRCRRTSFTCSGGQTVWTTVRQALKQGAETVALALG
jgi:hypothetical protein